MNEKIIEKTEGAYVWIDGKRYLNFCSNDYLGLSQDPEVRQAAKDAIDQFGPGLSSVRFISGTTTLHKALERKLADYLGMEDCILYSSCFMANLGLFSALLGEDDTVVSDELNHASLIDGMRLCKATITRFKHNDLASLETEISTIPEYRPANGKTWIVSEGLFSMDGDLGKLKAVRELADKYGGMLVVDVAHSFGVFQFDPQPDIVTGTLGKALGAGMGGFIAGSKEIVGTLREKSRTSLFSNALPPANCASALVALDKLSRQSLVEIPAWNELGSRIAQFSYALSKLGLQEITICPIIPIITEKAEEFAQILWEEGIFVVPFSYPVVPKDKARVRIQISALHTEEQINDLVKACEKAGKQLGII